MDTSKLVLTAMVSMSKLNSTDSVPLIDKFFYRSMIGALQYLVHTRPQIAFSVNKLCHFMQNSTTIHWVANKRILRYLRRTSHYGLMFTSPIQSCLNCYADAEWTGSLDDRRSTGSFVVHWARIKCLSQQRNNSQ